jgi:hypothetical protein
MPLAAVGLVEPGGKVLSLVMPLESSLVVSSSPSVPSVHPATKATAHSRAHAVLVICLFPYEFCSFSLKIRYGREKVNERSR